MGVPENTRWLGWQAIYCLREEQAAVVATGVGSWNGSNRSAYNSNLETNIYSMVEPFLDYLATEFMKEYHGDKEHYEAAFDSWLENLDNGELIEYGNKSIREIALRIKGANGAPAHVLDEIVNEYL